MDKIKLGVLLNPSIELNFDIIQEFYANATPIKVVRYSYCSFVQGRVVLFDRNSVGQYLNHPFTLQRSELCSYQKRVSSKKWRLDLRRDMNIKVQLYATILLYNIKSMSQTSTIPIDSNFLLHYMIKGWLIDVAQVISNEIQNISISGHSHGNKAPMTPGFPALIMGLCRKEGVDIPNMDTKMISSIVNDDYMLGIVCQRWQVRKPLSLRNMLLRRVRLVLMNNKLVFIIGR
ncbi:hypothetical protein RYX36_003889 [Vicia faba]